MNIIKNGFYKVSSDFGKKITIGDNLHVAIFDDNFSLFQRAPSLSLGHTKYPKREGLESCTTFSIGENSTLEYFSFFAEEGIYNKHFICDKNNSKVIVKSLLYSENNKIESTITGELRVDNTQSYSDILSFAGEGGEIKLDGILKIGSALKNVKGRLDEENIFLGESGKISGIPTLLVETNDVEASHSCKMEKISDEKLFYLRSRGVGKENAMRMMIEAKIKNLYSCLQMYDKEFYDEILEKILEKIK